MRLGAIWVPGQFTPTNQALSDLRAAGHYAGYRRAMLASGGWRSNRAAPEADKYAAAAADARLRALAAARTAPLLRVPGGVPVKLTVELHGHGKLDVQGAALPAKWLVDGLVAGGVLTTDHPSVVRAVTVTVPATQSSGVGAMVYVDRVVA